MSTYRTLLSIMLAGAFAIPAFAATGTPYLSERGEASYSGPMPGITNGQPQSSRSRAEVERELLAAGAGSGFDHGEATYSGPMPGGPNHHLRSTKTRADVVREVIAARESGTLGYVGDYPRGLGVVAGATPQTHAKAPRSASRY